MDMIASINEGRLKRRFRRLSQRRSSQLSAKICEIRVSFPYMILKDGPKITRALLVEITTLTLGLRSALRSLTT